MSSVFIPNHCLIDYNFIAIKNRRKSISDVPEMHFGNMPLCAGSLLIESIDDKKELIRNEPLVVNFIKPLICSKQFINNLYRGCIWLVNASPKDISSMPLVKERIRLVKEARLKSTDKSTRKRSDTSHLFRDLDNPKEFIFIPAHSSENRRYIPIGFFNNYEIPHNSGLFIPTNSKYIFGVLHSKIHLEWLKQIGGKLESRYRYSKEIVYNNFPFPKNVTEKQKENIETLVTEIFRIRDNYKDSSLADMYGEYTPATDLMKVHQKLDKAVEKLYQKAPFSNDKERIEFLFKEYEQSVTN